MKIYLFITITVATINLHAKVLDTTWKSIIPDNENSWSKTAKAEEIEESAFLIRPEKSSEWESKIKSKKTKNPQDEYNVVVAQDGSGDFVSIQDAIYASKSFPYQRVIIKIKNGIYKEKVHVYSWNTKVSLIGESVENTIITFDDYFDKINLGRNSTFHTATVLVEGNDFIAKNLTIKNASGPVGQAVALSVNANRAYFENCKFYGFQDTLYTSGEDFKQYFKNCFIEGTTDFIFGEATVLFQDCVINSKSDSYVTAASTPQGVEFGYVFIDCNLTADDNVSEVYLGRPWRMYAKTVFVHCNMGEHIRPVGWHNWSNLEAEKNTFYAEFENMGEGFKPKERVGWAHQLTKQQAEKYTIKNILGEYQETSKKEWYEKL
ncbi:pectin esterase [Muricauda sp. CAU 1633]|uniref:pectinesterase family protein n=1 Tax=Allomuricauda sp. CAU 1633 TaxID=2816036 RepID=UPI001A8F1DA6|nr:pectinesterase family protein [Muricauda sp. CAU 1633]MBO0324063.1 pectin esterase [Muricauda sp. CAU 1633]